jgi:hypothetical protein
MVRCLSRGSKQWFCAIERTAPLTIDAFFEDDVAVIVQSNLDVGADDFICKGLAQIAFGQSPGRAAVRMDKSSPLGEEAVGFTGRYEVSPDLMLDVKLERGHLFLRGTGGEYLPLISLQSGDFFFPQFYVKASFSLGSDGRVTALLQNGDYSCTRVSDQPSPRAGVGNHFSKPCFHPDYWRIRHNR